MTDCERFVAELVARVAGSSDDPPAARLAAHARVCADCAGLLELDAELSALGAAAPEPSPAELAALSTAVLRRVAPATRRRGLSGPLVAALAASLVFALGVWLGQSRAAGRRPGLVAAMAAEAAGNRALDDVQDSRFIYSNVSLRRADTGRVALEFDVTTHVQLVEPEDSQLVRDVLVHALLDESGPGARLRALSFAAAAPEPKVTQALIVSLASDESLAVRRKALEVLARRLDLPDVQAALLAALRDDPAVQVRLEALDALAAHGVDSRRLHEELTASGGAVADALAIRLAEHERRRERL